MLSAKKWIMLGLISIFTITPVVIHAAYVSTTRDTDENPEAMTLEEIPDVDFDENGYAELATVGPYTYYWQERRDVLAIYDSRNGYTWRTGVDIDQNDTKTAANSACNSAQRDYKRGDITFEEFQTECDHAVDSLTALGTGAVQGNALVYIDYYSKGASDTLYTTNTIYSNYLKGTSYLMASTLSKVNGDDTHWLLTINASQLGVFDDLDLQILVDIYLSDQGFQIEILDENITGTARDYISAIGLAKYMGAVGGLKTFYTAIDYENEEGDYYNVVENQMADMIDGYAFVPDGTGALIRFRDNSVSLKSYKAYVYGSDPSQSFINYNTVQGAYVPFKTASIPLYGVAHGYNQAAFMAYATSGAEYMTIESVPEENIYNYNTTYAYFNYNHLYNKLYTMDGDNPVLSIEEELNTFDITMNYEFLAGDGSSDGYPASYVGMARKYKDHLIAQGDLTELDSTKSDIGIRIDFLMADAEKSIVGFNTLTATSANEVVSILEDLQSKGIKNISSGLLGWQAKGLTLGNPSKAVFSNSIGSKTDYRKAIDTLKDLGIDVSFYQDYYTINEEQLSLVRNASKHPAGWYARYTNYSDTISEFYYARPVKSVEWLDNQTKTFLKLGVDSLTVDGITRNLITDYTGDITTRTEAIALYQEALASLSADTSLNLVKPNQYLFKYTDRYLQMDVYNTQYLIETDTVPFMQLLLQNTMELYAIYANFSFYTTHDVLRMIDYNLYPSFVLTQEPSYLLTDTNSSTFYSTEYALYETLIQTIYDSINLALSPTIGSNWINREVIASGVVRNTYENGVVVLINYGDEVETVGTTSIQPESFVVLGGE